MKLKRKDRRALLAVLFGFVFSAAMQAIYSVEPIVAIGTIAFVAGFLCVLMGSRR